MVCPGGGEHGGMKGRGNADEAPPAASKLYLDGETMKTTVLWTEMGNDQESHGGRLASNRNTIAYHQSRLHLNNAKGGMILDPATGKQSARNVVTVPHDPHGANARFNATEHMLTHPYTFSITGDALLIRDKWSALCIGR
jgi:hypothetical protein